MRRGWATLAALIALASIPVMAMELRIGSKAFTESVILGEIAAGVARSAGIATSHRRQLGGTRVLWNALTNDEIDLYAEYTGTLIQEIFAGESIADSNALRRLLEARGVTMTEPLGFNNTYALGMLRPAARGMGIHSVSDLAAHPDLRLGFSNEFMDRMDGWPGLRKTYGLPHRNVVGLDHALAYRALHNGDIDVTDLYSTDAEIPYYDIQVLRDDRHHFPEYQAVYLVRRDVTESRPAFFGKLQHLSGQIDNDRMARMNAQAKLDHMDETAVAAAFLRDYTGTNTGFAVQGRWALLLRYTWEHLVLVTISLGTAIVVAVPAGALAARYPRVGRLILSATGMIQTVPSLALLVFMIPLLGIGGPPAVTALFLYSLLPIVRNTHAGLCDIPVGIRESAIAIGLSPGERLRLVELPLAMRSILAGIKTSAVINIGTATLGALIGAGGYGQPILTGIRLDDEGLILLGAVPAAAMALAVQALFGLAERCAVPKGLRIQATAR